MFTKSTIQQAAEVANSRSLLLEKANSYIKEYDIENLYLNFKGDQVDISKIISGINTSKVYHTVEEAINNIKPQDILYIYKGEFNEQEYRILS